MSSIQLSHKLAITLLFSLAILLALAVPSSANGISPDSPRRRDHVNLNRMIRIRAAAPLVARQQAASASPSNNLISASVNTPTQSSSLPTPSSTSSSPTPSDTSSSAAPSVEPSSSLALSTSSSAISSVLSSTLSSDSASPTSSTASTHSTTSSASTPSLSTSDTPTSSTQKGQDTSLTTANGQPVSVDSVTLTSHVSAGSSAPVNSNNAQIGGLSHTSLTIIIVLAASVGGCAIIWTIIRKWKFRPSAQFEDRLEPINWQPTEHDSGLPTHRRVPSTTSSFHSAGHDSTGLARSNSGAAYNPPRSLTPLPDHDFTAGPAILAPVGGYADLARGPSPQPQMQEALQRGPSVNRGYETYPGPALHPGGGYGVQEAYDTGAAGY